MEILCIIASASSTFAFMFFFAAGCIADHWVTVKLKDIPGIVNGLITTLIVLGVLSTATCSAEDRICDYANDNVCQNK